jgi:hypothetical protein
MGVEGFIIPRFSFVVPAKAGTQPIPIQFSNSGTFEACLIRAKIAQAHFTHRAAAHEFWKGHLA